MKKIDKIMCKLSDLHTMLKHIESVTTDKAVKLEQALVCVESQLKVKQSLIDTIVKERNELRAENEALRNDSHILEGRLRHLLQSATVRLFDEKDLSGDYVKDIKRLDTYGVHYKMREYEANGGPKNAKEREAQKRQCFQEGDVLTGPNRTLISFPNGNSIKVKNPDGSYYLITRDGLEMVSPDGKRLKVN
jgi:hypothetical protein